MFLRKEKQKPLVSIIVPCFNSAAFIRDTLDSVLNQTYSNWECIVVNDGSTDNSEKIVDQYILKDKRFKCIHQVNQGLSSARNTGIINANGEYLNFLDSDDLLLPQMLEKLTKRLINDNTIGVAYCGSMLSDITLKHKKHIKRNYFEGQLFFKLAHRNIFACHSIVIRRKILQTIGYFDTTLFSCEDWDLWLRVAKAEISFGAVKEDLVIYRMRPFSMSRNAEIFLESGLRVIQSVHNNKVSISEEKLMTCNTCSGERARVDFIIKCLAISIIQNKSEEAVQMLKKYGTKQNLLIRPIDFRFFLHSIRNASGNINEQDELTLQKISLPLFQFLVQVELLTTQVGFAFQTMLHIIQGDYYLRNKVINRSNGRDLLNSSFRLLATKILNKN
jgi:glycosyltransferase involved in cell wall biosynthesis